MTTPSKVVRSHAVHDTSALVDVLFADIRTEADRAFDGSTPPPAAVRGAAHVDGDSAPDPGHTCSSSSSSSSGCGGGGCGVREYRKPAELGEFGVRRSCFSTGCYVLKTCIR